MCAFCSVAQVRLSEVGPGYCRTSVNTAVFRAGSLVTHGEEQYVSYYDADGYVTLGKRHIDSDGWTVRRTQYKGNVPVIGSSCPSWSDPGRTERQ